jgi:hypothetical protein
MKLATSESGTHLVQLLCLLAWQGTIDSLNGVLQNINNQSDQQQLKLNDAWNAIAASVV